MTDNSKLIEHLSLALFHAEEAAKLTDWKINFVSYTETKIALRSLKTALESEQDRVKAELK